MILATTYESLLGSKYAVDLGWLFGVSGMYGGNLHLAKVLENGQEVTKMAQAGLFKISENKVLEIKKVLGITDKLEWACACDFSLDGQVRDETSPKIGQYYVIFQISAPGTYCISNPTQDPSLTTEQNIKQGIVAEIKIPSAGIYLLQTSCNFTAETVVMGYRDYAYGSMEYGSVLSSGSNKYKQIPTQSGVYTDEGIYYIEVPNDQVGGAVGNTSIDNYYCYGLAPVGATEIHLSRWTQEKTKEVLEAELLFSISDIQENRTFWTKEGVQNSSDFTYNEDAEYCATLWCEAPPGGEFLGSAFLEFTCLSGDTLITMADGSTREMQDIKIGDYVLSNDNQPTQVLEVERGRYNLFHTLYYFDNGSIINETHDHRFFNIEQNSCVKLKNWNLGDHAQTQEGKNTKLIKIEKIEEPAEMFGIYTESGYYWANGLLSGAAFSAAKESFDTDGLTKFINSIPKDKLNKIIGEGGWFE